MSTLEFRINEALRYRESIAEPGDKVNKAALAKYCDVKMPSVSNWFNGRTKELTGINLIRAAQYLQVNAEWLGSGKGRMIPEGNPPTFTNVNVVELEHTNKVPLISWVQAGEWCEAADPFLPGDADNWLSCPVRHS